MEISAFAISRSIYRDEVGRAIGEGLGREIEVALRGIGVSSEEDTGGMGEGDGGSKEGEGMGWVKKRVVGFVKGMFPLIVVDEGGRGGDRARECQGKRQKVKVRAKAKAKANTKGEERRRSEMSSLPTYLASRT